MASQATILGHISIGVRDCDASEAFYTATLGPLGLRLVYKSEPGKVPRTLGYGLDDEHEILNIFEYPDDAHAPGSGFHVAFNAPSRTAAIEFYEAAVQNGGTGNGEPGLRPHYGPSYFAAFAIDPDGWRLEAVCQSP
jgi:catechol 2,3-dioxygenase-like lactoylglutathione lyase family enzyme